MTTSIPIDPELLLGDEEAAEPPPGSPRQKVGRRKKKDDTPGVGAGHSHHGVRCPIRESMPEYYAHILKGCPDQFYPDMQALNEHLKRYHSRRTRCLLCGKPFRQENLEKLAKALAEHRCKPKEQRTKKDQNLITCMTEEQQHEWENWKQLARQKGILHNKDECMKLVRGIFMRGEQTSEQSSASEPPVAPLGNAAPSLSGPPEQTVSTQSPRGKRQASSSPRGKRTASRLKPSETSHTVADTEAEESIVNPAATDDWAQLPPTQHGHVGQDMYHPTYAASAYSFQDPLSGDAPYAYVNPECLSATATTSFRDSATRARSLPESFTTAASIDPSFRPTASGMDLYPPLPPLPPPQTTSLPITPEEEGDTDLLRGAGGVGSTAVAESDYLPDISDDEELRAEEKLAEENRALKAKLEESEAKLEKSEAENEFLRTELSAARRAQAKAELTRDAVVGAWMQVRKNTADWEAVLEAAHGVEFREMPEAEVDGLGIGYQSGV